MVARDLRKQQAFDVDPRTIQQINFTTNLDREMFFIIEETKNVS